MSTMEKNLILTSRGIVIEEPWISRLVIATPAILTMILSKMNLRTNRILQRKEEEVKVMTQW